MKYPILILFLLFNLLKSYMPLWPSNPVVLCNRCLFNIRAFITERGQKIAFSVKINNYLTILDVLKKSDMNNKLIKLFLRLAISVGFLSAVADRFGWWSKEVTTWGNWDSFLEYTGMLNPWLPESIIPIIGTMATIAEIVLAIGLIIGFKTEGFAKLSGFLLLMFALSMTFSVGIKAPLDYSVFIASAAAFALSQMKEKHYELDNLLSN